MGAGGGVHFGGGGGNFVGHGRKGVGKYND